MKLIEKKQMIKLRNWVAMTLVGLAQWIYPRSESVCEFYNQLIFEEMVHCKSVVRVDLSDFYKDKN